MSETKKNPQFYENFTRNFSPSNDCINSKDEYFICLENDGQLFTRNNKNCGNEFKNWMNFCDRALRKEFLLNRFIVNQTKLFNERFIKE